MAKVKNNKKGVWSVDAYHVLPEEIGILPDDLWARLKKTIVIAGMLKSGELTEVAATSPMPAPVVPETEEDDEARAEAEAKKNKDRNRR